MRRHLDGGRPATIDRTTPDDVVNLATDAAGQPMQVAAVLLLDTPGEFDAAAAVDLLARRIAAVPRMGRRLLHPPLGCGRPVWVDVADFDPRDHISVRRCPAPGDRAAVLAVAAELVARRLDREAPLWSASFLTEVHGDRTALIVVFHHVLADGIGGLAVLASLVDEANPGDAGGMAGPAAPPPSTRDLLADAWRERLRTAADWRTLGRRLRATASELAPARRTTASRTSLNRPVGHTRRLEVVRVDLGALHTAARHRGASVNDAVLAAVGAALGDLLAGRGESAPSFVVSIPVTRRRSATAATLGNDVGVAPITIPATGSVAQRLGAVSAATRRIKDAPRERDLVAPFVTALARLRLIRPFLRHQHMINTLVTNLRGPDGRFHLCGAVVDEVLPVSVITGNVTVAFAVLSYAGTLTTTLVADATTCPDVAVLRDALERRLAEVVDADAATGH